MQAGLPKHALSLELDAVGCIIQALLTSLLIVAIAYSALKPALARPSGARRPYERPPLVSKATLGPSSRRKAPGTEQNIENGLNGVKHLQEGPADVNGANGALDFDHSPKEELIHTATGTHQRTTAAVRREPLAAIRENAQQNEIEISPSQRQVVAFYTLLAVAITVVAALWLRTVGQLPQHPLVWIVQFLEQDPVARVGFCVYWLVLLLGTLLLIPRLGATPAILVRKAYHLLAVAMFAPALLHQVRKPLSSVANFGRFLGRVQNPRFSLSVSGGSPWVSMRKAYQLLATATFAPALLHLAKTAFLTVFLSDVSEFDFAEQILGSRTPLPLGKLQARASVNLILPRPFPSNSSRTVTNCISPLAAHSLS
jgi:hypothetical protein